MVVPYLVIDQASISMGLVSTGSLDQQDQDAGAGQYWTV